MLIDGAFEEDRMPSGQEMDECREEMAKLEVKNVIKDAHELFLKSLFLQQAWGEVSTFGLSFSVATDLVCKNTCNEKTTWGSNLEAFPKKTSSHLSLQRNKMETEGWQEQPEWTAAYRGLRSALSGLRPAPVAGCPPTPWKWWPSAGHTPAGTWSAATHPQPLCAWWLAWWSWGTCCHRNSALLPLDSGVKETTEWMRSRGRGSQR